MENMPLNVPNIVIDASAGSGKTEELGKRLIGLLFAGVPVESIITMTFTRLAAGEIYERLIRILYTAANDEKRFAELIDDLNESGIESPLGKFTADREKLLSLLHNLIHSMNRINISTLDSFFAKIVQSFPVELGLPGESSMLDESEGETLQNDLIRMLLSNDTTLDIDDDFIEAGKESAYGKENKLFFDACGSLIRSSQEFYDCRLPEYDDIWTHFSRLPRTSAVELREAYKVCEEWIDSMNSADLAKGKNPPLSREKLQSALYTCAGANIKTSFTKKELDVLKAFFNSWDGFQSGMEKPKGFAAGYEYASVLEPILVLLKHARDILIYQTSVRSGGMRKMLLHYAEIYRRRVLEEGRIAFADLPRLLNNENAEDWIYDIGYRLNGRLKHWLVDEFQDTSRDQWKILARIIDDTQDQEHSLFIVGDIKQAIYGWRQGDSKLMREAADRFNLAQIDKNTSYRYGQEISDSLNYLFSDEKISLSAFPELTRRRWSETWRDHESAPNTKTSVFKVWQVLKNKHVSSDDEADPDEALLSQYASVIAGELTRIAPWERGLEAAILVRSKADGIELNNLIGEKYPEIGKHLIWEGDDNIANDQIVSGILALLIYLQHPANTLCREVALMIPSVAALVPGNETGLGAMLSGLMLKGLHDTVLEWINSLPEETVKDDKNIETFLSAAKIFENSGRPFDAIRFREFINRFRKNDTAVKNKVRIMSIHHSKGLGMDLVFTALKNNSKSSLRDARMNGFIAERQPHADAPDWILYSPGSPGKTVPQIREAAESKHADGSFEELCALYVALTRAKQGAYLLLPPPSAEKLKGFHGHFAGVTEKEKPKKFTKKLIAEMDASYYISDFIFDSLFGTNPEEYSPDQPLNIRDEHNVPALIFEKGNANWYETFQTEENERISLTIRVTPDCLPRRRRIIPSVNDDDVFLPFALPDEQNGNDLGSRIHRFFESIEFLEEFGVPENTDPEIAKHFKICAENPDIRNLLCRPECNHELWRERSFELITKNNFWMSGCFDRVLILFNGHGFVDTVKVIDFKSDSVTEETVFESAKNYRPQMRKYQTALSELLKIEEEKISMHLIFTKIGKVVEFQA